MSLQLYGKGGDGDVARLALAKAKAGAKADAQPPAIGAAADSDRHRRARGQGGWLDAALDVHRGDLLGRLDVVACREALQVERGRNRVDIALLFQRGRRGAVQRGDEQDRKSTRLNYSH